MSFFDTILSRSGRSNRPILPLWRLKITDTEYQALKDELAAEATKAYGEALFRGLQREAALFVAEYWRREYIDGAHREQDVYDALPLDPVDYKHLKPFLDWCGETRTTLCKIPGQGLCAFWAESVFSRQTLPTYYGLYCAVRQIRRAGSAR